MWEEYGLDIREDTKDGPLAEAGSPSQPEYEAPSLVVLGTVHELTLTWGRRCFWDKKLGGTDGFTFMGIAMPISDCSS